MSHVFLIDSLNARWPICILHKPLVTKNYLTTMAIGQNMFDLMIGFDCISFRLYSLSLCSPALMRANMHQCCNSDIITMNDREKKNTNETFPNQFLSHEKNEISKRKLSWLKYHKANKSYPWWKKQYTMNGTHLIIVLRHLQRKMYS